MVDKVKYEVRYESNGNYFEDIVEAAKVDINDNGDLVFKDTDDKITSIFRYFSSCKEVFTK